MTGQPEAQTRALGGLAGKDHKETPLKPRVRRSFLPVRIAKRTFWRKSSLGMARWEFFEASGLQMVHHTLPEKTGDAAEPCILGFSTRFFKE